VIAQIRTGVRVVKGNIPLLVGLYLGKLVLAAVATIPMQLIIYSRVDFSILARTLLKEWNLGLIAELVAATPNAATALILVVFMIGGLAFLVRQFLNGGIYAALSGDRAPDAAGFFANCGRMFLAHLRISAAMAPVYLGLLIVSLFVVSVMPSRMFGWWGNGWLYVVIARFGVTGAILMVGSVGSDIIRLQATRYPNETLGFWIKRALNYLRYRVVQTIGAYLVYAIPMLAIWLLVERLALTATGGLQNTLGVAIELMLFQICSLIGVGQSLLFVATIAPMTAESPGGGGADGSAGEAHD
jgi:hypothetical protein